MAKRPLKLSASAINSYKACPMRFFLGYIEGVRRDADTEAQRVGTNYHAMHEVLRNAERDGLDDPYQTALDHLNDAYVIAPSGADAEAWEAERTILGAALSAYRWLYADDPIEVIASELEFDLPLRNPKTGMPLPKTDVRLVGKIDQIIRRGGKLYISDFKTTSRPIDPDSEFWSHLRLDTQVSLYVYAAQELIRTGQLEEYGIGRDEQIAGAWYDVWKRPKLKPSKLTQADTKKFLESGEYLGTEFDITEIEGTLNVDDYPVEIIEGKNAFAIRESPGMLGVRYLQSVINDPHSSFVRREIPRTQKDMDRFRGQLWAIYQSIKAARDGGHWYQNEQQCEAKFKCEYTPICYHGRNEVVAAGETPSGFKRIFTDLTVEGKNGEETARTDQSPNTAEG